MSSLLRKGGFFVAAGLVFAGFFAYNRNNAKDVFSPTYTPREKTDFCVSSRLRARTPRASVYAVVCVLASLIAVPITVREDKLFWTFCAFCASTVLLLGVCCLYTRGNWFRVASGAFLLGMSAVFLPFAIMARPVRELIGESNRALIVLGVDAVLLFKLLNAIETRGRLTLSNLLFSIGAVGGIACVLLAVLKNRKRAAK